MAVYMILMAVTVLIASAMAPETRDRDLTLAANATDREVTAA